MTDATPAPTPPREPPAWLLVAGPLLVALLVYAQTFTGDFGFVNYDDPELVSPANPAIGQGIWAGLRALLDPGASPQFLHAWLPLYYVSIGIDHALGELLTGDGFAAAWVYHLHSVLLHGGAAALLVQVARRLGLHALAALGAGVLFAVHPLAVESVAWVAGRKDSLSLVWMLVAALVYLRGVERGGLGLHVLGALCLAVSLVAKGTTLVLPFLLAVHELLLRKDDEASLAKRLLPVVPYAVVAAAFTALHAWVAAREGTAFAGGTGGSLGDVLVANLAVVGHYVIGFLAPVHLSVEHGLVPGEAPAALVAFGAVALLAWIALAVMCRKTGRTGSLAVLIAVPLALAPFNNVFPRTTVLFAERYAYVPLAVVCLGLAGLLLGRADDDRRRPGLAVLAAIVLAVLTVMRVPVWSDSERLWADAAEKTPASALARLQLGQAVGEKYVHAVGVARRAQVMQDAAAFEQARIEAERLDETARHAWTTAAEHARTPLETGRARSGLAQHLLAFQPFGEPDPADARRRIERVASLLDEAVRSFEEAAAAMPAGSRRATARAGWLADPLSHRATALELLSETERAAADWEQVAKFRPDDARAKAALGRVYRLLERNEDAVAMLGASRELEPRDPALVLDRVKVWISLGQAGQALEELTTAVTGTDGSPLEQREHAPLHVALGRLNLQLRRPKDAADAFRAARRGDPADVQAKNGLGAALLEQAQAFALREDLDMAREAAQEAVDLMPGQFAPHQILAIIDRRAGRLDEAVDKLRTARELYPKGRRIRDALAGILIERAGNALRDGATAQALVYLEEAVALQPEVVATPARRLELGVRAWPATPTGDGGGAVRVDALCGLAWLAIGDPESAREHFEAALRSLGSADRDLERVTRDLWARCLYELGRPDEALAAARDVRALGAAPGEEPWRPDERLASALMEHGIALRGRSEIDRAAESFDAARALLDTAVEGGMPESRRELRLGEIRFAEERFLAATTHFDAAVKADPYDVDARLDLAAVWRTQYLLEEDPSYLDGAVQDLKKALEIAPGDSRVLAALGETLVMQGRQSDGLPFLMRAILADPSQKGSRVLAARLMVQAGRRHLEAREMEQARTIAERALALDPPHPEAMIYLAEVQRAENDWERARVTLEDAHVRWPNAAETRDALADFYAKLGHGYLLTRDRARAVTAFHKALSIEDADIDAEKLRLRLAGIAKQAFGEGLAAVEANDHVTAQRAFRLSAAADPTPETWFALGVVASKLEDPAGAVEAYGNALELRADYLEALVNRASAYLEQGLLNEAEADYVRFLETAPDDHGKRAEIEREVGVIRKVREELDGETPR